MVAIKKQLVSSGQASRVTSGRGNNKRFITIHDTGNTGRGANAQAHANIQTNGNSRAASWHYQVDDDEIIQSFSDDYRCWHAGDGGGNGNMNSISIEICINSDGNYTKAVQKAAELTKYLMDRYNISIGNVRRHWDWSRKYCPRQIMNNRAGISWNKFKDMASGGSGNVTSGGTTSVSPKPNTNVSLVDYLNSVGIASSFSNRKKLASENGISNYVGSASQNTTLLNRLQNEAIVEDVSKDNSDTSSSNYVSVVDYLNATGQDSSFSNRAKLAKKHGISNYTGTASQNIQLLNALDNGSSSGTGKSIAQMANEILDGKHGNGHSARQSSLGVNNSTYQKVRNEVNRKAGGSNKSIDQMAKEVIDGKHGNGHTTRRKSLGINQSTYNKVRNRVNQIM